MAIKYLNHIFKKERTAVSATPLSAPAEYTPEAMSQADAAAQYASMYNSLSSAGTGTITASIGSGYSGPAHVTWGPTIVSTWDTAPRNVSEAEFKQLQVHVIELTELVGELLEEVRYLRSGKAA
jgi:hypothetical protein